MKYLWPSQSTVNDVFWLIELTKFECPYIINAFIDHLVHGYPVNLAAAKNGLDKDNLAKKLKRLEWIEAHYQKRNER
jgi:hypothetical protein